MRIKKFLIFFALIQICSLINTNINLKDEEENIEVKYGDKIFATVPSGKIFTIKVKGNATTGFLTFIKNFEEIYNNKKAIEFFDIEYDNLVKLYKSKDYEIIHPNNKGSEGYFVYKIKVLKPLDDVKLEFITIKPWEIKNKNAKYFTTTVTMTTKDLLYLE